MSVLPNRILLTTDGSEDAALATRAAVTLAERSGAELHLVHVWHDVPSPYAHAFVKRQLERQGQEVLDEQARRIEGEGVEVSGAHLREGRISDEVLRLAGELGAGLLIVGSRGLGQVGRILMGSHSEEIVHGANLPVLVVRRGTIWPPRRLVIGDDYSEDARKATELAAAVGGLFGVREAGLIHAYPRLPEAPPETGTTDYALQHAERELEARAAEMEDLLGYQPRSRLEVGEAAVAILEAAQEENGAALVAVGSRGLGPAG